MSDSVFEIVTPEDYETMMGLEDAIAQARATELTELLGDHIFARELVALQGDLELLWPGIERDLIGELVAAGNGRLPRNALSPIPGGYLEHAAELRWNSMRSYIGRKHGVWITPSGPNSSYRSYAAQVYFRRLYESGRGNVAAVPGTSNHGWGRAVDVATPQMALLIRRYMARFGWSHAEGDRVGEWWHFTYVGGGQVINDDPLRFLEPDERAHVKALRSARTRMRREERTGRGPRWHAALEDARKHKDWLERRQERIEALTRRSSQASNRKHRRGTRRKIIAQVRAGKKIKL